MASSWERLYSETIGSGGGYEFDTGVAGITAKEHLRIEIKIVAGSDTYNGNPVENNIVIRFKIFCSKSFRLPFFCVCFFLPARGDVKPLINPLLWTHRGTIFEHL